MLRAVLEHGVSPEVESRLGAARYLITSRLSLVESARALSRLRINGRVSSQIVHRAHMERASRSV